ncbi:MAG TPA: coenzyme F420-0:L-glutamate ligase [Anaerolineales bacterium]|nr:coenzyme F420-0:L-glutamate ligase [Anaerolineales bacterium]
MSMVLTALKGIPLIRQGDDLADVILSALPANEIVLQDDDILVLGQKIVSKAEGRMVNLADVSPGQAARELAATTDKDARLAELILRESRSIVRTRPGTIIVEHKLGFICANAGIDHSNVAGAGTRQEEYVLLLPKDPDATAAALRKKLAAHSGRDLGVAVIDSHGRAWRIGTVGMCIGLSGVPAVIDERGWQDLFGYTLRITMVGVADELAAAASLVMGQAAEGTPIVHVRGFPYPLREGSLQELIRPRDLDLFR